MPAWDAREVLAALADGISRALRPAGYGCARAVPRIDGSLYFDLYSRRGRARLEWLGPLDEPGALRLVRGGKKVKSGAVTAAALKLLRRLSRRGEFALIGWYNLRLAELRFDDSVVDTLLAGRMEPGRTRWFSYVFEGVSQESSDRVSIAFRGSAARVVFEVRPALPANESPRVVLRTGVFFLILAEDGRPARARSRLPHQLERFLGFLLCRATHDRMRLVCEAESAPSGEPAGQMRVQVPAAGPFSLLLGRVVCNARCIFCSRGSAERQQQIQKSIAGYDFQRELETIRRALAAAREKELFMVGGHEPALYPTIFSIIEAAREAGFRKRVMLTNGLALADPELARRFAVAGLTEVTLPVYGVSAAVHDGILGVEGALESLERAMDNVDRLGMARSLHTVVLKQNAGEIEQLVAKTGCSCDLVMPATADAREYERLCPRLGALPKSVLQRLRNIRLPCLLVAPAGGHSPPPINLAVRDPENLVWQDGVCASAEKVLQTPVKPDKCQDCRAAAECTGIFPLYLRVYGDGEFSPF